MRRYDDPVEVRLGSAPVGPARFRWRGKVYVVAEVLAHWSEIGAWWQDRDADGLPRPVRTTSREVWRVAAQARRSAPVGVYDLVCDDAVCDDAACDDAVCGDAARPSSWRLARALD